MVSAYPIALEVSSTHTSPLSTPSVSPANSLKVEDRVHALLSAADSGTHEFSHGDWPDFSEYSSALGHWGQRVHAHDAAHVCSQADNCVGSDGCSATFRHSLSDATPMSSSPNIENTS